MTYKTRESMFSNSTWSSFIPLTIRQRTAWLEDSILHVSLPLAELFCVWKSVTDKIAVYSGWRNGLFFINIPSVIHRINVFKCLGEILRKWNRLEKSYPNYRVHCLYLHCVKHSIRVPKAVSKSLTGINLVRWK